MQLLAQFLRQRMCVQHLSVCAGLQLHTLSSICQRSRCWINTVNLPACYKIFFPTKLQTLPKDKYSSLLVLCSIQLLLRNTSVISNFISILYSFLGNNSKKQLSKIIVLKVKCIIFK